MIKNINNNIYNTTSTLSAACRALAIAICGVILAEVINDKATITLTSLIPLISFFIIDIIHYLVPFIKMHKLYDDLILNKCNETEAGLKMLHIQRTTFYFVYLKVAALIVAIIVLATSIF